MRLKGVWITLGRRAAPLGVRLVTSGAVAALYAVGMLLLIAVPPSLFLAVTHSFGANIHGALMLTPTGRRLLVAVFAATFAWSIGVGGFARTFLRPRFLAWPVLSVLGLLLLLGLVRLFGQLHEAVAQLHPGAGNDNDQALGFFAFWILMIGYAGKAVWDEARDRVSGAIDCQVAKETAQGVARAKSGL